MNSGQPRWNTFAKLEGLRPPKGKWKHGSTPCIGSLAECIGRWLELPGWQQRDCSIHWGYIWGDEEDHGRMEAESIADYVIAHGLPPHVAAHRGGQPPAERIRELVAMPRYEPVPVLQNEERWHSTIRRPPAREDENVCGKFTAMASWAEVVAFSQPLTVKVREGDNDRVVTYRVMDNLPLIVWDESVSKRFVVPTRWGWPQKSWKTLKYVHARSDGLGTTQTFTPAFLKGQRGIVVMRTFNEAPDLPGPTIQHTITPGELSYVGIAFLWQQFDVPEIGGSLPACVMVTVEANQLIRTLPTDRMPAVLADEDWEMWLRGTPDEAKACLKTMEGVKWTMTKEDGAAKVQPRPPIVSGPAGLS